jgi:hypothetical protein
VTTPRRTSRRCGSSKRHPDLDLILIESGGDNLPATFSPELADASIFVIDVSGGDKIPRKGGPGTSRSDLLVINKIDLADMVSTSPRVSRRERDVTSAVGDRVNSGVRPSTDDRRVRIRAERIGSRTAIVESFRSVPFHLGLLADREGTGCAEIILQNVGPGTLPGDRLRIDFGSRARGNARDAWSGGEPDLSVAVGNHEQDREPVACRRGAVAWSSCLVS